MFGTTNKCGCGYREVSDSEGWDKVLDAIRSCTDRWVLCVAGYGEKKTGDVKR